VVSGEVEVPSEAGFSSLSTSVFMEGKPKAR